MANRKMFTFPNDFLEDSFLLGLAIITKIVFFGAKYLLGVC